MASGIDISVVIPTTGKRKELLNRAIDSTRLEDSSLVVEVIVVVNGKGSALEDFLDLEYYSVFFQVRVLCTERVGASHARNIGMKAASGYLLRFLDDDDFLIRDVAKHQYIDLLTKNADLSTYSGRLEDMCGLHYRTISPPSGLDYGSAVLGDECPALTFATVYRSDYVRDCTWDEEWGVSEDEDWMRRMLDKRVPNWITSDTVVGVWYQHSGPRLSPAVATHLSFKYRAISILSALERMEESEVLRSEHKIAAARGIWSAIHGGFPFAPFYWTEASKLALELDPRSRPKDEFFYRFSAIPAVVLEWIILPKRWFNHLLRLCRARFFGWEYRRNF